MKIKSIQLRHVTHFTDTKLDFIYSNKPITLIMGDQGSGKTTLLKTCHQALTWFSARYKDVRTAGLVMNDQDIMQNRLQSKVDITVSIPTEIGSLPESNDSQQIDTQACDWQLYKTLNKSGTGLSKVETQKLEHLVQLYQNAVRTDSLQGLPFIAYYPTERFVNEISLVSKNNPAIFQPINAYETTAIPFTTFARFFEWFREISDIENAQTAELLNRLVNQQESDDPLEDLSGALIDSYNQMHAPSLSALKDAFKIIFPELSNIYIQYLPKLQLMVTYKNKTMMYQQLPNSTRNWIALVGDIVRRLCLLNPANLYPCLEGEGVLLIDQIDHQLDQNHASIILERLHTAFPRLQIIVTGNRSELLENSAEFQCLKLENNQLHPIQTNAVLKAKFDQMYLNLNLDDGSQEAPAIEELKIEDTLTPNGILQLIQENLDADQQQQLIELLADDNNSSSEQKLHE
jgi:predicted ATP-binding protein involved in virulence